MGSLTNRVLVAFYIHAKSEIVTKWVQKSNAAMISKGTPILCTYWMDNLIYIYSTYSMKKAQDNWCQALGVEPAGSFGLVI
jgi:hypothetical protein